MVAYFEANDLAKLKDVMTVSDLKLPGD